jgi:hypothetical protein
VTDSIDTELHGSRLNRLNLNSFNCDRCNQCQLNRSQYASIRFIIRYIIIRFTLKSGKASHTCLPFRVDQSYLTDPNTLIGRFILNLPMCDPGLESLAFHWTREVNGDFQIWSGQVNISGFLQGCNNLSTASSSMQLCHHLQLVTGKAPYVGSRKMFSEFLQGSLGSCTSRVSFWRQPCRTPLVEIFLDFFVRWCFPSLALGPTVDGPGRARTSSLSSVAGILSLD